MMWRLFRHEMQLWWRQPLDTLTSLVFFVLPVFLFGLGTARTGSISFAVAQALMVVVLVLALLLSLDRLFRSDHQHGILTQWRVRGELGAMIGAKLCCLILVLALPLTILAPLLLSVLAPHSVTMDMVWRLMGIYALLAVDAALLGMVVAALAVAVRQPSMVLVLIFLPLCLPIILFAQAAGEALVLGAPIFPPVSVLLAFAAIAGMVVVPITRYILTQLE